MPNARFVPNPEAPDLYRNYTISFPGGSLTATKDVLASIFKNDRLPNTCDPETKEVRRKASSWTSYPQSDEPVLRAETTYTLKNYSNGGNSRAAAGEPVMFLINDDFWTARLVGSHQDFMDYLCENTESLEGEFTYWVSQKGSPYFVAHSAQND